ncbi:MAG TPA: amidohydrolase family protein [Drouetiella sp.]
MRKFFSILFVLSTILVSHDSAFADAGGSWAIHGKAVTASGISDGWLLVKDGVITDVGASKDQIPQDAKQIDWNGYIFPGLIDTHNHTDWNVVPQWTRGPFSNRYIWQVDDDYKQHVDKIHVDLKSANLLPEARKFGEIRALIGGTTLLQGSYDPVQPEPNIMVRNLDVRYKTVNIVKSVDELDKDPSKPDESKLLLARMDRQSAPDGLQRAFFHLGEGLPTDSRVASEFTTLLAKGFGRAGVVCIHGLACKPGDFKTMAQHKMYLVWSPVSNWNLYRAVADIPSAVKAGLVIAIAPDWTISGSDNVLEEMKFAYAMSRARWGDLLKPQDIFRMVTSDAATVSGVDKNSVVVGAPMGTIGKGYAADFFMAPALDAATDGKPDPYESLLRTYPKHIHLVFIDGKPVYGDKNEMAKLCPQFDTLSIQQITKAIVTTGDVPRDKNLERLSDILRSLRLGVPDLAPYIEN